MSKIEKPLPEITADKIPFWEAARRHELLLMKCVNCGQYRQPLYQGDSFMCPHCNTTKSPEWVKATGRGKVLTWTVVHRAFHPAFAEELPFVVAIVTLDEGVRMTANLRGVKPEDVKGDMEVEVFFEKLTENINLPQFRPKSAKSN
jgi:uncharacterized OB-fold protein